MRQFGECLSGGDLGGASLQLRPGDGEHERGAIGSGDGESRNWKCHRSRKIVTHFQTRGKAKILQDNLLRVVNIVDGAPFVDITGADVV